MGERFLQRESERYDFPYALSAYAYQDETLFFWQLQLTEERIIAVLIAVIGRYDVPLDRYSNYE